MKKGRKKKDRASVPNQVARQGLRELEATLTPVVENILAAHELELVLLRFRTQGSGQILQMFLDKPGGVTLDDCVYWGRHLGDVLDVYITGDMRYRLEISSPGTDRPLTKKEHFNRFVGQRAIVCLSESLEGRSKFTGVLEGATDSQVTLVCDDGRVNLERSRIASARLHPKQGENP